MSLTLPTESTKQHSRLVKFILPCKVRKSEFQFVLNHGRFTSEDFHWFSFRSPLHEDSGSQKAQGSLAHLVGSTCSKVLKIQQCTEIKSTGNPSAAYKLVTILYILYMRKGTHLIPKHCWLVILVCKVKFGLKTQGPKKPSS